MQDARVQILSFVKLVLDNLYKILFTLSALYGIAVATYNIIAESGNPILQRAADWINRTLETFTNEQALTIVALAALLLMLALALKYYLAVTAHAKVWAILDVLMVEHLRFHHEVFNKQQAFLDEPLQDSKSRTVKKKGHYLEIRAPAMRLIDTTVNRLAVSLLQLTGRHCNVSFKSLDGKGFITTIARDTYAPHSRAMYDEAAGIFHYKKRVPFTGILDNPSVSSFTNNHLLLSSLFRSYTNETNHDWKKYYNAGQVVPVTLVSSPNRINAETVLGFLCTDNKGGGYNHETLYLLRTYSRLLFYLHYVLHADELFANPSRVMYDEKMGSPSTSGADNEQPPLDGHDSSQPERWWKKWKTK